MATQYMAAVSNTELRRKVGRLADQIDEISEVLDMLFLGFLSKQTRPGLSQGIVAAPRQSFLTSILPFF